MQLLERAEPLAVLEARLTEARVGTGSLTLIAGEAGIGKTSVVRAFCARHDSDAQVLWGWCDALSTPRPLGPLYDLARAAGGELASVVVSDAGRHERFAALLGALVSPLRPVVAVVEDVHWADEATLDLLVYLARRVETTHACVVVTYRDDELPTDHPLRAALGHVVSLAPVRRVRLARLSESAVARLAAAHDVDAAHIHRVTGGNPYFVTEMLAAPADTVPETVRDAVLARAGRLSPRARSTLDAVAVVPDRVDIALLRAVIGGDADGIDECERAGLLAGHGRSVSFRHELARLAVEQAIPATRAADLHAAVLAGLAAQSGADCARLAYHADLAGDIDAVLTHAPVAADQAARVGAYRAVAAHCALALRYGEALPATRRAELLELYGLALGRGGQIEDAVAAYEQAEHAWREAGQLDRVGMAMALRGQYLWAAARPARAREVGDAAVALLAHRPPGPALAAAYTYGAYLRMLARDRRGAVEMGNRAIALAEQCGETALLSKALNVVGTSIWSTDPDQASATMARCLAVAHESGDDQTIGLALGNWGSAAVEVRRYAEGDRRLRDDAAWCGRRDLDLGHDYSQAWLARSSFEQGDWPKAAAIAADLATQPVGNVSTRTIALTVLGQLRVRRGDADALPVLVRAWQLATEAADPPRLWPIAAARAEAAWLAGHPDRIPDLTDGAFALATTLEQPWAIGELAFWRWRAGQIGAPPPGAAEPYALQISGDWAGAARAWDAIGCPYEAATARADSDRAEDLLAALHTLHRLGARPAADLVRRGLRRLGVRRLPRRPQPATAANPGGLTARELEVLALIVDDLSNADIAAKLFISRRTVDHHVAAILAKLGVPHRGAAAQAARRWAAPDV